MRRNHSVIGCPRHIYVVFFFAHILFVVNHTFNAQRSGRNNISSFLQRTAPIARFFCEGWIRHDLHILVTAPFCCDRKARAACAQSFAPWQKATIEIMRRNHSIIGCSRYICFFSSRTSRLWWITQSTQHHRRGRNSILLLWPLPVVIAKLRFVTISTIMCLSAGPTRGGYKRYIVPCSGRYWEDENTHAMCFCNKAQNYLCVPVASMPIDLFLYLGMVAVLSTF